MIISMMSSVLASSLIIDENGCGHGTGESHRHESHVRVKA
jgi:hypothetical protein